MDAYTPSPGKLRKPGMPSLTIPPGSSPYASSSSSGDDGDSSGQSASTSQSTSIHNTGKPSQKPKLSLFGVTRPSSSAREDVTVAPGFENMALEDKTMKPGVIYPPHNQPQLPNSTTKAKPKLALGSIARTPSPLPGSLGREPYASTSNYTTFDNPMSYSSVGNSSEMTRSTSFEGALIAETSHVSVDGDDYKLGPDTLQDLGRLGEGASGEVRRVLHRPSGTVMAKKVNRQSFRTVRHSVGNARMTC